MPLVTATRLVHGARAEGRGVGAFNVIQEIGRAHV